MELGNNYSLEIHDRNVTKLNLIKPKSIYFISKIEIPIAILSFLCLRPFALGYSFTNFGLAGLSVASIIAAFKAKSNIITPNNKRIVITIISCFIPALLAGLIWRKDQESQDIVIVITSTIASSILFSQKGNLNYFFKLFILLLLGTIISSTITFLLNFPNQIPYKSMIVEIPIRSRGDFDSVSVYFPFSPLYTYFSTTNLILPRFSMFFIESGIASGFLAALFAMLLAKPNKLSRNISLLILIVGGFITFSTSFIPTYSLAIIFNYLSRNKITLSKILIFIAATILAYYLFNKIPLIGFTDKSETHGSSFDDRINYYSLTTEHLANYFTLISATILMILLVNSKRNKLFFLSIISSIYFVGLINVVFFSPLFIAFCFFDSDHFLQTEKLRMSFKMSQYKNRLLNV